MKNRIAFILVVVFFVMIQLVPVIDVKADERQDVSVCEDVMPEGGLSSEKGEDAEPGQAQLQSQGGGSNGGDEIEDASSTVPGDASENLDTAENDMTVDIIQDAASNVASNSTSNTASGSLFEAAEPADTMISLASAIGGPQGFSWASRMSGTSLPDQGMYVIEVAAETGRLAAPSKGNVAFGTLLGVPKSSGAESEAWVLRCLPDGYWLIENSKNSYTNGSDKPSLGINASGQACLMKANVSLSQTDDIKWQLIANSDGSYSFCHKKTGKYLDSEHATQGKNPLDVQNKRNSVYQKFYLYSLKSHELSYTYTDNLTSEVLSDNTLEIRNLNDITLDQNRMTTAASLANISVGSGVSVEVKPGFANKCNWALGSDGTTLLPAYYVTMPVDSQGSDEEYVRVTYPQVGTWFDGRHTWPIGAVVCFSNIRPADNLFRNYDGASAKEPAEAYKSLIIGTNLFGGYWYYNIEVMDMTITFFRCDSGEAITPEGAYLTFNSLSNTYSTDNNGHSRDVGMGTSDAYGEFIGVKNRQVTGFVSGPAGSSENADEDHVTNVRAMNLEMWSPYAPPSENYGTMAVFIGQSRLRANTDIRKQAAWEDALGGVNFARNSVSIPLDETAAGTTFVVGAFQGGAWNSLSSASIYANVKPVEKAIVNAEGDNSEFSETEAYVSLKSGKVVFRLQQDVPQIGFDTTEAIESLIVTDTLPEGFSVTNVTVCDNARWTYDLTGDRTVTFRYSGDFRDKLRDPEADTRGVFDIEACLTEAAKADETLENIAETGWQLAGHEEEREESNPVYVTPFDPKLPDTVIHVPDTGGFGYGKSIRAGLIALGILLLLSWYNGWHEKRHHINHTDNN